MLSLRWKAPPVIDGFTGPQRFFLGWAQAWACKHRDAALRQRLMTDPHSPAMYRVLGWLRICQSFMRLSALSLEISCTG